MQCTCLFFVCIFYIFQNWRTRQRILLLVKQTTKNKIIIQSNNNIKTNKKFQKQTSDSNALNNPFFNINENNISFVFLFSDKFRLTRYDQHFIIAHMFDSS